MDRWGSHILPLGGAQLSDIAFCSPFTDFFFFSSSAAVPVVCMPQILKPWAKDDFLAVSFFSIAV